MDCYDEILEIYQKNDQKDGYITCLTHLINKKSRSLTELQFKNCVVLTLAIWNPKFIDLYVNNCEKVSLISKEKKERVIKLLKSEFREFQN
ncbi:MAG: hypothetical protein ACFFEY_16815 [Candidatus Thorarchaeota archaeon]